ncbi:hypothetical protein PR003_g15806 [Phytophthora rubi]|nr:hypothetical protein PR003_g15806 [Phytophthora rubi]
MQEEGLPANDNDVDIAPTELEENSSVDESMVSEGETHEVESSIRHKSRIGTSDHENNPDQELYSDDWTKQPPWNRINIADGYELRRLSDDPNAAEEEEGLNGTAKGDEQENQDESTD